MKKSVHGLFIGLTMVFTLTMVNLPEKGIFNKVYEYVMGDKFIDFSVVKAAEIKAPENLEQWRALSEEELKNLAENLSSFDSRNYNIVPSIKSQGQHNICWAFGSTAATEISMLKEGFDRTLTRDNIRFYEINAAYRISNKTTNPLPGLNPETFRGIGWDIGRQAANIDILYSQWRGPVSYTSTGGDYEFTGDDFPKYLLESSTMYSLDTKNKEGRNKAKELILKFGAVSTSYNYDPYGRTYWNSDGSLSMGHQIAIVGWDDTVSKSNFDYYKTPGQDGAWLVRDSWGTGFHDKGYFWLSYDSPLTSIITYDMGVMKYDYNYYYDSDASGVGSLDAQERTNQKYVKAANIYKAVMGSASKQEELQAVNVFLSSNGENNAKSFDYTVEISVYKGLNGIDSNNPNKEGINPEQGEPVVRIEQFYPNAGCYTIELPTPVLLERGEYFSIVVRTENAAGTASIRHSKEVDSSVNDMSYYYLEDGNKWVSTKIGDGVNAVARIKGYTKMVEREVVLEKHLKNANIVVGETKFTYDGTPKEPEVHVYYDEKPLELGKDYIISYENNIYPGSAIAHVIGLGEFEGQAVDTEFTISKAEYPFGGNPKNPIMQTIYQDEAVFARELALPDGWEFVNPDLDLSTLVIGKETPLPVVYKGADGDYYDNIHTNYWITYISGKREVGSSYTLFDVNMPITVYEYTGAPIKPEVLMKASWDAAQYSAFDAIVGYNYYVRYENNINPGTATAVIIPMAGHAFDQDVKEMRLDYTILAKNKIDISSAKLEYQKTGHEYNLTPITPDVKVTLGEKVLERNKEYTVSYSNNDAGGTGRINVMGIGEYEGVISGTFSIYDPNAPTTDVTSSEEVKEEYKEDENTPVVPEDTPPVVPDDNMPEIPDNSEQDHQHSFVTVPGKAATCTETGLSDKVHCSSCDYVQTESTVIDMIPHVTATRIKEAATCTEDGYKEEYCTVCNSITTANIEIIPATGHQNTAIENKSDVYSGDIICQDCRKTIETGEWLWENISAEYKITFKPNGGSGKMSAQKGVYKGSGNIKTNAYKKKGHSFKEWNTKADGTGNSFNDGVSIAPFANNKPVVLYAQWEKVEYTIEYVLNEGQIEAVNPESYYIDTATITLNKPTREGYTFGGWYRNPKLSGSKVAKIKKGSTGDKTYYAKWNINKYTIVFKGNRSTGGSMGKMASREYGKEYTLKNNTFKKKGYTFVGWNTQADGTGESFDNMETVSFKVKNKAVITLYAQWQLDEYTITYNNITDSDINNNPTVYDVTNDTFKLAKPEREGSVFKGWYTNPKFTGSKVTAIKKGSAGDKVYYAKWK